jgi:hypothetical protein
VRRDLEPEPHRSGRTQRSAIDRRTGHANDRDRHRDGVGARPSDLVHSAVPGLSMRIAFVHNGDATLAVEITDVDQGGSDINDWKSVGDSVAQSFAFSSGT